MTIIGDDFDFFKYPLDIIPTLYPIDESCCVIQITNGVFPLPPTVIFPIIIIGDGDFH